MIGARHAVGAQQRAAIDLEADHGELPILEAEAGIAGSSETEESVGPMANGKYFLSIERAHVFSFVRETVAGAGRGTTSAKSRCFVPSIAPWGATVNLIWFANEDAQWQSVYGV